MKFAVFTVSLPDWTPEEAVTHLAEQGWDGIEWRVVDQAPPTGDQTFWQGNRCTWPASTFAEDVPRIRSLTEAAGLGMPSIGAYARSNELAAVERLMAGAQQLGVTQMRVPARVPDGSDYTGAFDASRSDYEKVADLAARYGVKALIELHHQTIASSCSAARWFLEPFDPAHVGVIHDIGNMVYEGFERLDWGLDILGPYLAHVHVKNAALRPRDLVDVGSDAERTPWSGGWAPLRHGQAPIADVFTALRGIGYDGWVSLEDFCTDLELEERIRDDLTFVRALAAAANA